MSQIKQDQLAAVAALSAFLAAEANTAPDVNFEFVQSLGPLFPPNPCDLEVIEEASNLFGKITMLCHNMFTCQVIQSHQAR
jgi:hypothetical protein